LLLAEVVDVRRGEFREVLEMERQGRRRCRGELGETGGGNEWLVLNFFCRCQSVSLPSGYLVVVVFRKTKGCCWDTS